MTYGSPGIIYTKIGEFYILGGSIEKNNGWIYYKYINR